MKLSDYIREVLTEANGIGLQEITFDLGVDTDLHISEDSKNRIKFTVKRR